MHESKNCRNFAGGRAKSAKTGEIVAEDEFEGQTTMSIPEEGDYEVYIYTESGTVMVGEFLCRIKYN